MIDPLLSHLRMFNLLRQEEIDYLTSLQTKFAWIMPSGAVTVNEALQLCRKEHTIQRLGTAALRSVDQEQLVNLTMKLIQCIDRFNCIANNNGGHCVEHILETSAGTHFITVPENVTLTELKAWNDEPDLSIRYFDLRYPNTLPGA